MKKGSRRGYDQLLHSSLVDGEVTGLCCVTVLNIIISSQALASLRATCYGHHVVHAFHLIAVLVSVKKKKKRSIRQMCLKKRKETFRMITVDIVLITGRQLVRLKNICH